MLERSFFTDIATGDLSLGELVATEHNINRGLTSQWILDVAYEYKPQKKDKEQADDETRHMRTWSEKLNLQRITTRLPPDTLQGIQLSSATFAGLVCVLFGKGCDLYTKIMGITAALHSPAMKKVKNLLPALTIRQWHWEMCCVARWFFHSRCKQKEFNKGIPIFPKSLLQTLIPYIEGGQSIDNITFPQKWRSNATKLQLNTNHH